MTGGWRRTRCKSCTRRARCFGRALCDSCVAAWRKDGNFCSLCADDAKRGVAAAHRPETAIEFGNVGAHQAQRGAGLHVQHSFWARVACKAHQARQHSGFFSFRAAEIRHIAANEEVHKKKWDRISMSSGGKRGDEMCHMMGGGRAHHILPRPRTGAHELLVLASHGTPMVWCCTQVTGRVSRRPPAAQHRNAGLGRPNMRSRRPLERVSRRRRW
jgi:hypothetical protein